MWPMAERDERVDIKRIGLVGLPLVVAVAAVLRLAGLDHLPPGLSYDEAFNVLVASRLPTLLPPPVYIPIEFGEEPAHYVLIAILYRLVGRPFAEGGRLAAALGGVFTVGALFFAARQMFRRDLGERGAATVGLLSAGVLAVLYWHVHYSRLGMEPPMTPTFSAPAFYAFWLALDRQRWPWFALAGAALGLCLYTYLAGYALPFVVVLYLAWRWATHPGTLKTEWRGALAYAAGAALAFAPHAAFFIQHPEWLRSRPDQVSLATGGRWYMLAQNAARMIGGLFWRGDANLRLNLPGRPALDWVQSMAFLAGLGRLLRRTPRDGAVFALIWLLVMLAPSVASDVSPHFGRALGATPPLAILVALGLWDIGRGVERAARRASRKAPAANSSLARGTSWGGLPVAAGALIVGLALAYSGGRTAGDYFGRWAGDPGLFTAFEVGLREACEYLARWPSEAALSLSPTPRDAPIFEFYLGARRERFKTFNGRRCAVYPYQPAGDFVHVAIVADEGQSLAALKEAFPSGQIIHEIWSRPAASGQGTGLPYAVAYHVPAGTRASLALDPAARFASAIELARPAGLARTTFRPGETLTITLTWRALAPLDVNYTSFVHLVRQSDAPQAPLAQEDAQPCDNSYPTTWWAPGEIIAETRRLGLPPDLPAGDYVLLAGWYDLDTGRRLPLDTGGDAATLAAIRIE